MALVTFANSDVIDSDDLNNNFKDKMATVVANMKDNDAKFAVYCQASNLSSAADYVYDFTPEDDYLLYQVDLRVFSGTASISIGYDITPITLLEESVPVYTTFLDYVRNVTTVVGEASDRSINHQTYLKKGITYRITLTSNSATAVARACLQLFLTALLRKS